MYKHTDKYTDVLMDIWMYKHTGHIDVPTDRRTYHPSIYLSNKPKKLWLHLTCKKFSLFEANFLHLNVLQTLLVNFQTALGVNLI